MRRNTSLFVFLPLLIAIILLSLPLTINQKLQELGGHAIATFFSISQTKKRSQVEISESNALIRWFQKTEAEKKTIIPTEENIYPFLIGKVIFRSINSWSSSVWIDVGSEDNCDAERPIICVNSPVLSGHAVVGVIDYVGKQTSLVRLITDSGLAPAVRVARGNIEYRRLLSSIEELQIASSALFEDKQKSHNFQLLLSELRLSLSHQGTTQFLAKGELQGHGEPLLRTPGKFLKGVGFQYDFSDMHGPSRALRSQEGDTSLIQTQDLLVTSGLDGVFPEGLPIARVHSIAPLKEGAIAYDILAEPIAQDLYDLRYVNVIAPQKFIDLPP